MTIWILHQKVSPEEEARIEERTSLVLPFDGLPDLSGLHGPADCLRMMQALEPDAPPERIARWMERTWRIYGGVHFEDIIAVPLPSSQQVAIAEVTGPYQYRTENGEDIHTIPVKWHKKRATYGRFGKFKDILRGDGEPMIEVTLQEPKDLIRERLPHKYNRFVPFKWLLIIFLGWRALLFLKDLFEPYLN